MCSSDKKKCGQWIEHVISVGCIFWGLHSVIQKGYPSQIRKKATCRTNQRHHQCPASGMQLNHARDDLHMSVEGYSIIAKM